MNVAIFGATGFIGKRLVEAIKNKGWEPVELDIRKSGWQAKVKDADAVVNLAGHPLFKNRWDTRIKGLIIDSRVDGTKEIVQALNPQKTKVMVNASAIGIYPKNENDADEDSTPADDFLARVCKNWEEEAKLAQRSHGIRTVIARFGVVLGKGGGALQQLLPIFKLGVGGTIGFTGSQSMSWVHIDDVVGIILLAIENEKTASVVNVTSPNIVSNKEFTKALGKVLHRPTIFPVPVPALYAVVGEAAGIVADGQRVHPKATLASGYQFKYPNIDTALQNILG